MPKKKFIGKHVKQPKHLKTKTKKIVPKTGKLAGILKGKKLGGSGGYTYWSCLQL